MLDLMLLLTGAGLQAAAEAATPAPEPAIEVVGKIDPKERRVCVRTTPTGSIMAKKQCKTLAQWEADMASGKAAADGLMARQLQIQLNLARTMMNREGAK